MQTTMSVSILLFDRVTALDAVGPYEVLSRLPGSRVTFVGERLGPVRADTGHPDKVDPGIVADLQTLKNIVF